jgi:hypothetical protein
MCRVCVTTSSHRRAPRAPSTTPSRDNISSHSISPHNHTTAPPPLVLVLVPPASGFPALLTDRCCRRLGVWRAYCLPSIRAALPARCRRLSVSAAHPLAPHRSRGPHCSRPPPGRLAASRRFVCWLCVECRDCATLLTVARCCCKLLEVAQCRSTVAAAEAVRSQRKSAPHQTQFSLSSNCELARSSGVKGGPAFYLHVSALKGDSVRLVQQRDERLLVMSPVRPTSI